MPTSATLRRLIVAELPFGGASLEFVRGQAARLVDEGPEGRRLADWLIAQVGANSQSARDGDAAIRALASRLVPNGSRNGQARAVIEALNRYGRGRWIRIDRLLEAGAPGEPPVETINGHCLVIFRAWNGQPPTSDRQIRNILADRIKSRPGD